LLAAVGPAVSGRAGASGDWRPQLGFAWRRTGSLAMLGLAWRMQRSTRARPDLRPALLSTQCSDGGLELTVPAFIPLAERRIDGYVDRPGIEFHVLAVGPAYE
jgi:hypothetical protein